jgi:fibronectin type 3 domain-containing protein
MDDNGHGTHCAGIVAAEDNDIGVIGVAPEAYLYAVKVLDSGGSGYLSDVIAGIQWSIDNGMQVISMSLGTSFDFQSLHDACDAAYYDNGILVVAAAGNSGTVSGKGDNVIYPAKYDSVIAVAATDSNDERAWWSSTGPDVELAAPGVSIYSTYWDDTYATLSGTSMACPHVTGTAALVFVTAVDPAYDLDGDGVWDASEVRKKLQDTADDLGDPGRDPQYGYGLVDADEAASLADTEPPAKVSGVTVTTVSDSQLNISWTANNESDLDHYNVYRSTTQGFEPSSDNLIASPTTNSYSDAGLTASTTYYYRIAAVDTSGNEGTASDGASGTTNADATGPVTSNVVADPNPTDGATSVTLTASVDDSTSGNSSIYAAEYFVGTVGEDGNGTPMSASDGAFDSSTEEVIASIDVSGWAIGTYTIYVHGMDAVGNWGTTSSVVLEVTEAPPTAEVHDVSIKQLRVPKKVKTGDTKDIVVKIYNGGTQTETVNVTLTTDTGWSDSQELAVEPGKGGTTFTFTYTFTEASGTMVTFTATATIVGFEDSNPEDNTATASTSVV